MNGDPGLVSPSSNGTHSAARASVESPPTSRRTDTADSATPAVADATNQARSRQCAGSRRRALSRERRSGPARGEVGPGDRHPEDALGAAPVQVGQRSGEHREDRQQQDEGQACRGHRREDHEEEHGDQQQPAADPRHRGAEEARQPEYRWAGGRCGHRRGFPPVVGRTDLPSLVACGQGCWTLHDPGPRPLPFRVLRPVSPAVAVHDVERLAVATRHAPAVDALAHTARCSRTRPMGARAPNGVMGRGGTGGT